jgi:hypothetical protein
VFHYAFNCFWFTNLLGSAIQPNGSIYMAALAGVWLEANVDDFKGK